MLELQGQLTLKEHLKQHTLVIIQGLQVQLTGQE